MKFNLLNLLKVNVLKAGAIKTIAPAPEPGKCAEFKSVLSDAEASPPPCLTTKIPNVEPPVERSAVLISKRYSKSHAETQGNVKENVKSEKPVEQVAQSVLPISPLLVVAQSTGAAVPQPTIVQSPPDVKQLPLTNRVVNKAESVVSTSLSSKVALTNAQNNAPVQRSGGAVVEKQTPTNRPVETLRTSERTKTPSPQSMQRVTQRDQVTQSPIMNRLSERRSAPPLKEVTFVRSPTTIGVEMPRESRQITAFVQRPAAETVKQELTASLKPVSSAMMEPKNPVSRDSDGQKYLPNTHEAAKPTQVVRPVNKPLESLSKSGNEQKTIAQPRGDSTHVEKVAVKLADTVKEVRSETPHHAPNRLAPAKEEVGAPMVPVSKLRFVATESIRAEVQQQVSNRLAPAKEEVGAPMVPVNRPRLVATESIRAEVQQQVSNRPALAKEEVGAPMVSVNKPRLVATESIRAEVPQQVSNRPAPAKEKVDIPMVRVTEPRIIVPEQVNHVVQDNERPRVVQQIWANDIFKADVKPTRTENTSLAKETQTPYKPQAQSKPFPNVDSAFVRPTLEESVLKLPTLADTKLNAAVTPRVVLKPGHVQQPQIDKQILTEPLHTSTLSIRGSIVPEQNISITALRVVSRSEKSEQNISSKTIQDRADTLVPAKKEQAAVVIESVRPIQPQIVAEKPTVQRHITLESILMQERTVDAKAPEARSHTIASPNVRSRIQSMKSEALIEPSATRNLFAAVPEFELPKQPVLSFSVNEPVCELIQTEASPLTVDIKPTPATRFEPKLETRSTIPSESMKVSDDATQNSKTPAAAKSDAPETLKDNATSTRLFKPLNSPEPQMQSMPQSLPLQTIQEFGTVVPRIDTTKAPEFTWKDRVSTEREEPVSRSTQERPQQVLESKPSEQSSHNGQDTQSQSRERESGQSAFRQTIEQVTQTSTQATITKPSHSLHTAANESLKLALQKALDQSRKRMIDPDELRMSIPFGELGTLDIDIVREAEKFSIRIAADPQAIAMMEDQRIQLTQWLRVQGYPVEQIDITPRFGGEPMSDLPGSNQSAEEQSSGKAGQSGRTTDGGSEAEEEHAEAAARPAFSGLRVWTA